MNLDTACSRISTCQDYRNGIDARFSGSKLLESCWIVWRKFQILSEASSVFSCSNRPFTDAKSALISHRKYPRKRTRSVG